MNIAALFRKVVSWSGKTILFAITFAVSLAVLAAVWDWYEKRPTPVRKWRQEQMTVGILLDLTTVSRGGIVQYQLVAKPSDHIADVFPAVAEQLPREDLFTLVFQDSDGFYICEHPVTVVPVYGDKGITELTANGSFVCGDDYKRVTGWRVKYSTEIRTALENARRDSNIRNNAVSVPREPTARPSRSSSRENTPAAPELEILVGFDFLSRELETKSGKRLRVTEGGRATVYGWSNASRLRFDCKDGSCTVENMSNREMVRATLIE